MTVPLQKKPTLLLVSSYKGYLPIYSGFLSGSYHVLTRQALPDTDDFIVKRASVILVLNLWKRFQDFSVFDLVESAQLPVIVVEEAESKEIVNFSRKSVYLTIVTKPYTNRHLMTIVQKTISSTPSPRQQARNDRYESAKKTLKSAFKSTVFRKKVDTIIDFLHKHYAEVENFSHIADQFDVNYESMRLALEQKTGMAPREYLREIRFEKILQLIQFTHMGAVEICREVGYRDVAYTRKLFKEKYGLTIEECITQVRVAGVKV
jgi:AraC-like DNA-binding protein